jgi:hypothetical protein
MASEEKETEQEPVDRGVDAQEPAEQEPPEQESEEQELVEQEPSEEDKKKKYWWLSLGLILLLLGGGGFFAMTGMRQAAHKLGGGSDYDQLSANSSVYDGTSRGVRNSGDYFPLDEEAARAQTVNGGSAAKVDRVNPALIRTKEELVKDASRTAASQAPASVQAAQEFSSEGAPEASQGGGGQAPMGEKLKARAFFSAGPAGPGSKAGKNAPPGGMTAAFEGNKTVVGKASEQRETKDAAPKKAGRGSVMESLKGAFQATFYGARLSSQDSAKSWIARTFDGTAESSTAIEYDEKMRNKLDKVNPNAIPGFLRNQDVSVEEAKRLANSDVSKPLIDKDATNEALAGDANYQKKKLAKDFGGSMINGIFGGVSGTGKEEPKVTRGGDEEPCTDCDCSCGSCCDDFPPEYEDYLLQLEMQEYIAIYGYGEDCGGTPESPACCMSDKPGGVSDGSDMVGDFSDFSGDNAFA